MLDIMMMDDGAERGRLQFDADRLRRSFARVGFVTRQLAQADKSRLGGGAEDWGSYYEADPLVLVGEIAPALPALAHLLVTCAERQEVRVH